MTQFSALSGLSAPASAALSRVTASPPKGTETSEAAILASAKEFEAVYLAEMLTHAGLASPRKAFGGGAGEEAFSSLMAREWADKIVERGGIGIADSIAESMMRRVNGDA